MKKCKIILITAFLLVMSLSISAYALGDIEGHWAKPYIDELVKSGAVSGYPDGTFRPDANIKIGEFIKIAVVLYTDGEIVEHSGAGWVQSYLAKAAAEGFYREEDEDLKQTEKYITRAQVARVLGRIAYNKYAEFSDQIHGEAAKISDFDMLAERDRTGVAFMSRLGVISGYPDSTFRGGNFATRAELCAIFSRFSNPKPGEVSPVYNQLIIKEGDGINTSNFMVVLDYSKAIEPQLTALQQYLQSKMSADELDAVINYVKIKENAEDALPLRLFLWKKGSLRVEAARGSGYLTIIGD